MLKCELYQLKLAVICYMEIKERHFREDKVWEFLYLINQITWQKVYVESDVNAKCNVFSGCLFYYYDTTFSAKTVYLRESGKFGSLIELKTPVKKAYL
jgi:hypothetical protein